MAKGQKRSNREKKKPKQDKPKAVPAAASMAPARFGASTPGKKR